MKRDQAPPGGPLAGLRVLDFTRVVAGPYCTMLLGDFGAEIIKIEEPGGGDELRALGPPFLGSESVFFLSVNRNKKSVTVDLKDAAAVKHIRTMARSVDVVVENFRPGVMDRLGLGSARLRRANPRLIYCSVSAFQPQTRLGDRPGYDLMVSGLSGLQSMTGEPGRAPLRPGINLVDLTAGMNAAIGILLAVIARQQTGRGQHVGVSLMDGAFALMGQLAAIYLSTGTVPARRAPEDLHAQIVPYGTFVTEDDRYLNVCVPNNKFWAAFCEAIDEPELGADPRFATNAARIERRDELIARLAVRFRQGSRDGWIERLLARGIPAGPVHTLDEVVKDGYVDEAGMLARMTHPACGPVVIPGIPIRLSATPGAIRLPPPTLGQHTTEMSRGGVRAASRSRRAARTPSRTRTRSRTR